jgi:hypothetical protein
MLSCKKILFFILTAVSVAGCMEQKLLFDFKKDVNKNFFKEIPGIGNSPYIKFPVTKKAERAEIYVSSFSEKYIEKDDLLEFTELNDSTNIPFVDYWFVKGYSQELYLIKYDFTYTATGKKGNPVDVPVEGAVFFSVKYNGKGNTIGVVPCYFGTINTDDSLINFDTPLSLKKDKDHFYLKLYKKRKNMNGLLFMPVVFSSQPGSEEEKLNIEKIVRLDPNKIGGFKPLVFDIGKIFHDPSALKFHYIDTLNLTQ